MAAYKCKMCGGSLAVEAGTTVYECEYCGTKQTVPNADDEKKMVQFGRANKLLRECEFDRAAGVFEAIVADFPEEAEAYWGLVLCRFGIEYVDDPATGKKVPTCHRSAFDSVMDDGNYELAMDYADTTARRVYREEAKAVEALRKDIIELSGKEESYDVFISYKETDDRGNRTEDSVIAQDIYKELTREGYRVFFSRVTLEGKLGTEYEPYIFAALHSAKVMLVVGTDYEYMNAVWVKNEWSRFLKLMAVDRSKTLIPVYKNMDAYDMPKEFAKLTAQDMGKIGALQDLLHGVEKLLGGKKEEAPARQETVIVQQVMNDNTAALLQRGFMALEDGEWQKADGFFEDVLNQNAQCAEAYLGKLMAEKHVAVRENLGDLPASFEQSRNYEKVIRFADDALKAEVQGYIAVIKNRKYDAAQAMMDSAKTESEYKQAAAKFIEIPLWRDANTKAVECDKLAEEARKNTIYNRARRKMESANSESEYKDAAAEFEKISGWKDANEKANECREKAETVRKNAIYEVATVMMKAANSKGDFREAAWKFSEIRHWRDADEKREFCEKEAEKVLAASETAINTVRNSFVSIACGRSHTCAVRSDGKVFTTGSNLFNEGEVENWSDIIAVACGSTHTLGLKKDGTVVATGYKDYGSCNVGYWRNVKSIACCAHQSVGVTGDGRAYAIGEHAYGCSAVHDWKKIVSVACGGKHTVGVLEDGTVIAVGDNSSKQCEVRDWKNIVAVACGTRYTVGLCKNGTVISTDKNSSVKYWKDVVAIACGNSYTVGLRKDGTVINTGTDKISGCAVGAWRDVVAIACGEEHTVGLRRDGTLLATGNNKSGQCNVEGWKLFDSIEALQAIHDAEVERENERLRMVEEERLAKIVELTARKQQIQAEIPTLKGLFAGSKRKKLEAEIADIDAQLKKLEK